jgi:hypothetical protein
MNKDKVIKDLKERNNILSNQYMQEQARNYHLNHVIENDLKPTLKGYEYEIITLKSDFEAQHELTKKYAEENKQLKDRMKKAVEIIKEGLDFDNPQYATEIEESLLNLLKEDNKAVNYLLDKEK